MGDEHMGRTTLTVAEVSKMIGVSPDSIYAMVREKQIPHLRIRTRILFREDAILNWMKQLEVKNWMVNS